MRRDAATRARLARVRAIELARLRASHGNVIEDEVFPPGLIDIDREGAR